MTEEIDLDFEFEKEELANFLENFASKVEDGEVGLSTEGDQEINITPEEECELRLIHHETDSKKRLTMEVSLTQELEAQDGEDEGRTKIPVKVV